MDNRLEHNACWPTNSGCLPSPGRTGRHARVPAWAIPVLITTALLMAMAGTATAKSLYVIAEIWGGADTTPIHAYDIGPDGTLTFQAQYGAPPHGAGTVGLAIDSYSEYLFITFENDNVIVSLDAATLRESRVVTAPGASNLAGIVYDQGRELLYCVDRGTQNLYAYKWDAAEVKLTHTQGSPFQLEDATAYGIALDETNDILYVANCTREITAYSTSDWQLLRRIPISKTAVSIAVDPNRDYLYYGGGFIGNFDLVQYDLANDVEIREMGVSAEAGVMGLGVDTVTGFIYVTTGQNNHEGGDDLLVINPNLFLEQIIEDIGNPTGLVIPVGDTSYNPLRLKKVVETPLPSDPNDRELPKVPVGSEFKYIVSFDPTGYTLRQVTLVDKLPAEVTFVDATGNGDFGRYDPNLHTYTWLNPPLATGARTRVELLGRLQSRTALGRIFVNTVTMYTDQTPQTTIHARAIAAEPPSKPLGITKTVVAASQDGVAGTGALSVDPGGQIAYRICFNNNDNDRTVNHVSITDNLPVQADFVSATGDGVFGTYDPVSHSYIWSYPSLGPAESNCVDLVVRLAPDATPGATITNKATIRSDQTPATSSTADVLVRDAWSLLLSKTLVAGAGGQADDRGRPGVDAGTNLVYALTFSNPSPDKAVTRISIVDTLPPEVSFVSADGDKDFGFYHPNDHTYTWSYPPLAPRAQATVRLTVHVNEQTEPNTVISNWATIQSVETSSARARADAVVRPVPDPVEAKMYIKPGSIFRNSAPGSATLAVDLHLPEGMGMSLIANTPAVLTPGNIPATSQRVFGTDAQGKLLCFFDTDAILLATRGYGKFDLTVTGRLTNGQSFIGKAPVYILKFGGP